MGHFVTGYVAIAQFATGTYVLVQGELGESILSMKQAEPEVIEFSTTLSVIKYFLP